MSVPERQENTHDTLARRMYRERRRRTPPFKTYFDFLEFCKERPEITPPLKLLTSTLQQLLRPRPEARGRIQPIQNIWLLRAFHNQDQEERTYGHESSDKLLDQLLTQDDDLFGQILVVKQNRVPPPWVMETLGLGLDIKPHVWFYLQGKGDIKSVQNSPPDYDDMRRHDVCISSMDQRYMLDLSIHHTCLVLDPVKDIRPKTVVVFIDKWILEDFSFQDDLNPSEVLKSAESKQQWRGGPLKIEQAIKNTIQQLGDDCDTDTFLYSAVHSLLSFEASQPLWRWYFRSNCCRFSPYYGYGPEFPGDEHLWESTRRAKERDRRTLIRLPIFVAEHFKLASTPATVLFDHLKSCLEVRIQMLDTDEALMRDLINMERSNISTAMAELSIKESKRVMLLTTLAFFFVPLSLSASIFGMNIQEINATGHSIVSFVITSLTMTIASLLIWLGSVRHIRYRNERESVPYEERKWYDDVLFIGGRTFALWWPPNLYKYLQLRMLSRKEDRLWGLTTEAKSENVPPHGQA